MPQSLVSAPDFCPNAEILFELRASQPGHAVASNNHASIADLERFEDEIDDLLLQKPNDDPMMVELRRRKARLQDADRMAAPQRRRKKIYALSPVLGPQRLQKPRLAGPKFHFELNHFADSSSRLNRIYGP